MSRFEKFEGAKRAISSAVAAHFREDYATAYEDYKLGVMRMREVIREEPNAYVVEKLKKEMANAINCMRDVREKMNENPAPSSENGAVQQLCEGEDAVVAATAHPPGDDAASAPTSSDVADAAVSDDSAARECVVRDYDVQWEDIVGLDDTKMKIVDAIEAPIYLPHFVKDGKIKAVQSVMFWGPPGTGKTTLARAIATHVSRVMDGRCVFMSVEPSHVLSKFVGGSEKGLSAVFKYAANHAPVVLFFDEIDAFAKTRSGGEQEYGRSLMAQFLTLCSTAASKNITLVGATNTPWAIDSAMRRRFKMIYVPLPDAADRAKLIKHYAKSDEITDEQYAALAELIPRFSGSDVANLVQSVVTLKMGELMRATRFEKCDDGKYRQKITACDACSVDNSTSSCCMWCGALFGTVKGGELGVASELFDIWPLVYEDLKRAVDARVCTPAITDAELALYDEWARVC